MVGGNDRPMSSTSGRLGMAAPNDSRSTSMDESREASRSSGELGGSSEEHEPMKESRSNSLRSIFSDIHSMSMNASPLPSSAPTWASSKSLVPSQGCDSESVPALVPKIEESGGEGGGEAQKEGEGDKVWKGDRDEA